jgi:hypothetical protein
MAGERRAIQSLEKLQPKSRSDPLALSMLIIPGKGMVGRDRVLRSNNPLAVSNGTIPVARRPGATERQSFSVRYRRISASLSPRANP